MEYIQRLPFILGGLAAFITGVISYSKKSSLQESSIMMTFALLLFFIIGLYARGILKEISSELEEKKKEDEKKQKEQELAAAETARREHEHIDSTIGDKIDIKVEDE